MLGKNDGSIIIRIEGDAAGYNKELNKVKEGVEVINGVAKKVALGLASAGAAVVGLGVKYNAEMEQYRAGLTTLLGDAEKADKILGDLKNFAAKTPFELTDLANASNVLLSFGEDVDNLMPDLKMLGDISLGNSEKFKSLALVFGQVQSQGKLMGQDLLQMINSGFNPLQTISEKTGESVSSLKDKMAKGQISFEMVTEAMRMATSEGGKFYNAMETQSKTFDGQMSTLQDNINALFGEMTSDISAYLSEDALPWVIEQVEKLNEAWENGKLQENIKMTTAVLVVFGSAVVGINLVMFAHDMIMVTKGVKDFTAVTKSGAAAQKLLNVQLLTNPYVLAGVALTALIAGIVTYAALHESTADEIRESLKEIREEYNEAIEVADKSVTEAKAEAKTAENLKNRLLELNNQIQDNTTSQEDSAIAMAELKNVAGELEKIIPGISDAIFDETGQLRLNEQAVNDLVVAYVNLANAKAKAAAYEDKLKAAYVAQAEAEDQLEKANTALETERENQEGKDYGSSTASGGGVGHILALDKANSAVETATEDLQHYTEEINKWEEKSGSAQKEVAKILSEMSVSVEKTNSNISSTVKTENTKRSKDTEEAFEKDLDALERTYKYGEISTEEYYAELAKIRNEHFEEGSEDWYKYTDEIYEYYDERLTETKESAISQLDEIGEAQKTLSEKLKDSANRTYEQYSIVEKGEETTYTRLADTGKSARELEQLNLLLERVRAKYGEELPDTFTEDLANMDVSNATMYLTELLTASEQEFKTYMEGLKKYEQEAEKYSSQVYKSEFDELAEKLKEEFGQIPEDFFNIGEDSAEAYGEGFMSQLAGVFARAQASISAHIGQLSTQFGVAGAGNVATNTYNDSRTTNIYAPSSSPRAIIEEQKQAELYQEHTGKWGG